MKFKDVESWMKKVRIFGMENVNIYSQEFILSQFEFEYYQLNALTENDKPFYILIKTDKDCVKKVVIVKDSDYDYVRKAEIDIVSYINHQNDVSYSFNEKVEA